MGFVSSVWVWIAIGLLFTCSLILTVIEIIRAPVIQSDDGKDAVWDTDHLPTDGDLADASEKQDDHFARGR